MTQQRFSSPSNDAAPTSPPSAPQVDPWVAVSRIIAGVALYGAVGWGLDRWWGTAFLTPIGIMLGAVLGLYPLVRASRV